ncbi:light-mediated development protein Det1 [Chloropicon primus]|uniref:Light-mediated development protein Det1 n=1 Tax=Chloropicon primus TaxID=1764295 RepID=A0A5B8MJ93_9CHLO|nr:light-mediated development protein Det1 [Chloropicon primus]UPQ98621.1 light-mediated development protein Det1 [Chloropicon primus]|eukprot:QDZ19412.1 light-mediated development protein Det1 [Chloropicon primus]
MRERKRATGEGEEPGTSRRRVCEEAGRNGGCSASTSGKQGSGSSSNNNSQERFWEFNQGGKDATLQERWVGGSGILRKIARREFVSAPPSSSINSIRKMCMDIYPCKSCIASTVPEFHIRAFTPDGQFLVCFSLDLRRVLVYRYCRKDRGSSLSASESVDTFLRKVFELNVCQEGEQLCKTFSVTVKQGRYFILASSTTSNLLSSVAERAPTFERVTLHVIDLENGVKSDEKVFKKDFIWLTQNNGISVHDNTLAVLSVKKQTIHFFHINALGKLVKIRSVGEFIYEDDELALLEGSESETAAAGGGSGAEEGGVRGRGSGAPDAKPYTGIQQRLLGYLVTRALKAGSTPGQNEILKDFFFHFKEYHGLIMWKMQMLDSEHLLIKFDKSPFSGSIDSQAVHARYSGVFNVQSGVFVCFFLNRNEELAYLYQNFTDFFRPAQHDHLWSRFVSSYSNDQFLRAQIVKQRDRYNKIYGSESELSKQLASFLPLSPQMTNSSPYLDARLFQFDDRFVSPYNCPRPIAEHAIKFLTRKYGNCVFKILPLTEDSDAEDEGVEGYATFCFHPTLPFVISSMYSNQLVGPRVMKFYYR